MKNDRIIEIEERIAIIKNELHAIQAMRPGTLTKQYKEPKSKMGGYYQLSFTHKMKSRTEYIRSQYKEVVEAEIVNYNKYKYLNSELIELNIEMSRLKMGKKG
jgi:hypothetical protein